MTNALPREFTLDDVLAFNQQLVTLSEAGLEFELNFGNGGQSLAQEIAQINARLAMEVAHGQSIDRVLAKDNELPAQYRAALKTWLYGDKPVEALNALNTPAEGHRDVEADVGYSFLQPLIILGLVYCGFIYLIVVTAPKLESIYQQIGQPASVSLTALGFARHWLPIWGLALPVAVFVAIAIWRRNSAHWTFDWVPGKSKVLDALRSASYAESVAQLMESDYSLGQALALLGPLVNKKKVRDATSTASYRIIDAERQRLPLDVDDPSIITLPPMLRWAFTSRVDADAKASLLRFTAQAYRDSAMQKAQNRQRWLPILFGVMLGGIFVLAFGLSLFVPVVDLLKTLAQF